MARAHPSGTLPLHRCRQRIPSHIPSLEYQNRLILQCGFEWLNVSTTEWIDTDRACDLCHLFVLFCVWVPKLRRAAAMGWIPDTTQYGPRLERFAHLSVSFDTIETRSVSDGVAICDTDRLFSPSMTLPIVWHHHPLLLILNTPFDSISSNQLPRTRHQNYTI